MAQEGARPSFRPHGARASDDAFRALTADAIPKIIPRDVLPNARIQGEGVEVPPKVHDVEDVGLLDPTVGDGPRKAPGPHVAPRARPATPMARPVVGVPSLLVARQGRPVGVEGVTAVRPGAP